MPRASTDLRVERPMTTGSVTRLPFRNGSVLTPFPKRPRVDSQRGLKARLVAIDVTACVIGWSLGVFGPNLLGRPGGPARLMVVLAAVSVAANVGGVVIQRLYLSRVAAVRQIELSGLVRASFVAVVGAVLANQMLGIVVSPYRLVAGATLAWAGMAVGRGVFGAWLRVARGEGRFSRPLLLVGANDEARHLARLVAVHPELGYRLVGVCGARGSYDENDFDIPWLGEAESVLGLIDSAGVRGVLVAASSLESPRLNSLIRSLMRNGDLHVQVSTGLTGIDQRRLRASPLSHEPLYYLEQVTLSTSQRLAKRSLDLAVATLSLVVAAPAMALIAVMTKLHDGGPVLFRQERVGRNGKVFTVFKFRTMVPDAEDRLHEIKDSMGNDRDSILFKLNRDPRRTRLGSFIEALSLDELPQLFNVIGGSMSLVGPRPALPKEVELFDDELLTRFHVPPGITGLWQVEARDNPAFAAYRRLDLFYVENWSLSLDVVVLVETASAVLSRPFRRRSVAAI